MTKIISDLLSFMTGLIWLFLKVLAICIIPFIVSLIVWFLYYRFVKKMKIPKRTIPKKKAKYTAKRNILLRLFVDFPRRFVLDFLSRNPDAFDTYGIHIFCGEQGSGKSIAAVHFIKMISERNPGAMIEANIDLDCAQFTVESSDDIVGVNNGELGMVVMLDEIQNWFSSLESKNFPPDMLTEITQQRKQRKCIVGTAQVFNRISKPIREQITLLYKPTTIAGCLTIVRVYRAHVNQDGALDRQSFQRMYFFVHDDELRNAYDTYAKVERLQKAGYVDYNKRIS